MNVLCVALDLKQKNEKDGREPTERLGFSKIPVFVAKNNNTKSKEASARL